MALGVATCAPVVALATLPVVVAERYTVPPDAADAIWIRNWSDASCRPAPPTCLSRVTAVLVIEPLQPAALAGAAGSNRLAAGMICVVPPGVVQRRRAKFCPPWLFQYMRSKAQLFACAALNWPSDAYVFTSFVHPARLPTGMS